MNLNDCYNFDDFRKLAKKKLPSPIFHYIDGGSDDEVTLSRNTEAFNDCDLIPNDFESIKKEKCFGKKSAYMIEKVVDEIVLAKAIRESDGTYSA